MSFTSALLRKYCEKPSRPTRRTTETSLKSTGKKPELLSKLSPAEAIATLDLEGVPPKIKSSALALLKFFASLSPKSQRIASIIFDLPLPFGPTIAVMPAGKSKIVFWAKDLKPLSSNDLRNMPNLLKFYERSEVKFYYKFEHPAVVLLMNGYLGKSGLMNTKVFLST